MKKSIICSIDSARTFYRLSLSSFDVRHKKLAEATEEETDEAFRWNLKWKFLGNLMGSWISRRASAWTPQIAFVVFERGRVYMNMSELMINDFHTSRAGWYGSYQRGLLISLSGRSYRVSLLPIDSFWSRGSLPCGSCGNHSLCCT